MANKIFRDMLHPQAKLSRNGFDRGGLRNFTAKIGELLPIFTLETVPGSHYEINVSDFMRTIPMNHASFIRASQHFEFYFVPYQLIWHKWDNFYTTRSNPKTTLDSLNQVPLAAPNAKLFDLFNQFYLNSQQGNPQALRGDIGELIGYGCSKVANLLGYVGNYLQQQPSNDYGLGNPDGRLWSDASKEKFPNMLRAAAYQKICYDYYRQPFYDLPDVYTPYQISLDDADNSTGLISPEAVYGGTSYFYRYAKLFQLHYRQWKKDLYTGILPDTQFGAVSIVNTGSSDGGTIDVVLPVTGSASTNGLPVSVSVENALHLVHKAQSSQVSSGTQYYMLESTGEQDPLNPSQVYMAEGVRHSSSSSIYPLSTSIEGSLYSSGNVAATAPISGTARGSIETLGDTGSFSVLSLVRAQAIQKWREVTMRSGFRHVNQYEGHFGVKPIFTEKDRCVFIDSVSSPLNVNSVQNTNAGAFTQSDGGVRIPLGDLGANGTSVVGGEKTIKFDAKDFGVIMCIYSMLPEATYINDAVDIMNTKISREDFFIPEYENIGMQPVSNETFRFGPFTYSPLRGFAPRYYEYKQNLDYATPEFNEYSSGSGADSAPYVGAFAGWCPTRMIQNEYVNLRQFYVNPLYFRNVWSVSPTSAYNVGDSRLDSFIHQCYFDVKCVQPMSVLGLPHY